MVDMSLEDPRPDALFHLGQKALYKGELRLVVNRSWEDGGWRYILKDVTAVGWIPEAELSKPEDRAKVQEPLIKEMAYPMAPEPPAQVVEEEAAEKEEAAPEADSSKTHPVKPPNRRRFGGDDS